MIIVGIDPGIYGAAAVFDSACPDRVEAFDLPHVARVIDGRNLASRLDCFKPDRAVIESVHAWPAQGIASAFRFGQAFGTVIGILEAFGLSIAYVSPSKWKRHYGLDNTGEASRCRALNLFPQSASLFGRKRDHHRAEAALIARYGVASTDLRLASELQPITRFNAC